MSQHLLAEANRHAKALPKKKTMSYDHITDTKKLLEKCADYRALVDRLEREVTVARTLHERDRENYQCAIKASIAVENQLKRNSAALHERLETLAVETNKQTEKLERENAALREDKERLEWLLTGDGGFWVNWMYDKDEWTPELKASRDAIDACRNWRIGNGRQP